ncbi:hypothetical protein SSAG_01466 [Streptomyces sp. Mg1]|nr:hypothetical protein SSAG_01466 [Streptomyces sp. Mg1]
MPKARRTLFVLFSVYVSPHRSIFMYKHFKIARNTSQLPFRVIFSV